MDLVSLSEVSTMLFGLMFLMTIPAGMAVVFKFLRWIVPF